MVTVQQSSPGLSPLPWLEDKSQGLNLESTLCDLTLYDFQVESSCAGGKIAKILTANPMFPGVVLLDKGRFVSAISRRRFFEHISRPYGLELFSRRPIKALARFVQAEVLVVPRTTLIVTAAQRAVHRSPELLYEPLVVEMEPGEYRLLDVHQLLIAQSHIHALTVRLLRDSSQQLEKANRELQRLAVLDGLTQVANRRRFDESLQSEWQRLARDRVPLSLILCDIDFFKRYNDTYGHQAGDACLKQVATAIQTSLKRASDMVARYGGEEFAAILPNTDADGAECVARDIRAGVRALAIPHPTSGVSACVTLSLGVATMLVDPECPPSELVSVADAALYEAKSEGRDRYVVRDRSLSVDSNC